MQHPFGSPKRTQGAQERSYRDEKKEKESGGPLKGHKKRWSCGLGLLQGVIGGLWPWQGPGVIAWCCCVL